MRSARAAAGVRQRRDLALQPDHALGTVGHRAGQLAARGVDVAAAGLARGGNDARIHQDLGEGADPCRVRTLELHRHRAH